MTREVFISHSSKDKETADVVCKALEDAGIKCWMAPRDVLPGKDYDKSILEAVDNSQVFFLLFSSHADASRHVKAEVTEAFNNKLPIIPIRMENRLPDELKLFLMNCHWFDAFETPLEESLKKLVEAVGELKGIKHTHENERNPQADKTREKHEHIVGLRFYDTGSTFKDREEQLDQLKNLLQDQQAKMICIVGRGGMGKTALLSKLCEEIERGELRLSPTAKEIGADGIIYISFRGMEKTSVERIVYDVCGVLEKEDADELKAIWKEPSFPFPEKVKKLLEKIKKGCYLLTLDNIEDILTSENNIADNELRSFIELCLTSPHGLKLVVTSRKRIIMEGPGAEKVQEVLLEQGLPGEQAVSLLRDFGRQGKIGLNNVPDDLLEELARRCDGTPRALEVIKGLLIKKRGQAVKIIKELIKNDALFNEQVVENLVRDLYSQLSEDQLHVIQAMAVFNEPVDSEAVAYLLDPFFSSIDVDECLSELDLLNAVKFRERLSTFELHPIDQKYAYSKIPDGEEGFTKKNCHIRVGEFWLGRCTGDEFQDIDHKARAWEHFILAEDYDRAVWLLSDIAEPLSAMHEWLRLRRMLVILVDAHVSLPPGLILKHAECYINYDNTEIAESILNQLIDSEDRTSRATGLEKLAWIYADKGKFDKALNSANESAHLFEKSGDEKGLSLAIKTIGYTMFHCGLWYETLPYFLRSIELRQTWMGEYAEAGLELAETYRLLGDYENAIKHVELFERLVRERRQVVNLAITCRVRGDIALDNLELEGAITHYYETIELRKSDLFKGRRSSTVPLSLWKIGIAHLMRNSLDESLDFLNKALASFQEQKYYYYTGLVKGDIGLCHHLRNNLTEAEKFYMESMALDSTGANIVCKLRLGILFINNGNNEKATPLLNAVVTRCNEILVEHPDLHRILYILAPAYCASGQKDAALTLLKKAINLNSRKGVVMSALLDFELLKRAAPQTEGLNDAMEMLQEALGERVAGLQ